MVDRNIIREFDVSDEDLQAALGEQIAADGGQEQIAQWYDDSITSFESGRIIEGRIINIVGDDVVVDVGYKSEGLISKNEFSIDDAPHIGNAIKVLLENVESESGLVQLSKRKADRIIAWEHIIQTCSEGDVVEGRVTRKIKGGLLVNIGVPVFLPASQVDIRRPADIGDYVDRKVKCQILKIDKDRRNIVVSRRKLIEREREEAKTQLMAEIAVGQTRKGVVKNIADFGVFVDLGGIDGLLHITDMSWGRISHPSEMVRIEQDIEVRILNIDKEKEKIALGLKQLQPSPWEDIETRYPVGSKITGEVVNIMSYGAFVKLEEGVEGLVHISEMSWTRRINHPSEMLNLGDDVEVVVLTVDQEKMRIALGLKQMSEDPWYRAIPERYIPGQIVKGKVTKLTNFGVFVELEDELEGLLHVSELADHKVDSPEEIVKIGDEIEVKILRVDQDERKIGLSLKRAQWAAEGGAEPVSARPQRRRGGLHGATGDLANESIIEEVLFHAKSPGAPPEEEETGQAKPTAEPKAEPKAEGEPQAPEAPGEEGAETLAMEILGAATTEPGPAPAEAKEPEPAVEKPAEPAAEPAQEPKTEPAPEKPEEAP